MKNEKQTSDVTVINGLIKTELASVFNAIKCVSLQDFARDLRKVRVTTIVLDKPLSDKARGDVYKIEQVNGTLMMVTGQSLMIEVAKNRHRVIALGKVLDLILT